MEQNKTSKYNIDSDQRIIQDDITNEIINILDNKNNYNCKISPN